MNDCGSKSVCGSIDICSITQGTTAAFCYQFFDPCGDPLNLTGMSLHLTMCVDPKQKIPDLHHVLKFWDLSMHNVDPATHENIPDEILGKQFSRLAYIDPDSGTRKYLYDFEKGKGIMTLSPAETKKLRAGQCYFYSFELRNGLEDIYPMGDGKINIKYKLGAKA